MPQIQIMNREPLPTKGNLAREQANTQADIEYKINLIKIYKGQLAVQAKSAQDEVEKTRLQDEANKAQMIIDVFKIAMESGKPQDTLITFQKMYSDILPDFMKGGFAEAISKLEPSGKEQLEKSQSDFIRQRLLGESAGGRGGEPTMPGAGSGMGGGMQAPGRGSMQAPDISQGSRESAVGGNFVMPSMNVGGMQLEDPQARAQLVGQETKARKTAELDVELEPMRRQINYFLETFDAAVKEMGGLPELGITAHVKGKGASMWAELGKRPATQALARMSKSIILMLASYANRGRPSDKDAEAMAGTIVQLFNTKGTNEILRGYLQTIVSGSDMTKSGDSMYSPSADRLLDQLESGNVSPDASSDEDMFKAVYKQLEKGRK